jgi:hypothetical protein
VVESPRCLTYQKSKNCYFFTNLTPQVTTQKLLRVSRHQGKKISNNKARHIDHQQQLILQRLDLSDEQWLSLITEYANILLCCMGRNDIESVSRAHRPSSYLTHGQSENTSALRITSIKSINLSAYLPQ